MNKFLVGALLAVPLAAQAMGIEAELGGAHFSDRGDGFWYQEGFPHILKLQSPAVSVGVTGDVIRQGQYGLAWHANYVYMGKVHTEAIATPDDRNYNLQTKSCNGECLPMAKWYGSGFSHGLRLTLEPYAYVYGWRIGVEAGYYISKNFWRMEVHGWQPDTTVPARDLTVYDDGGWRAYPTFGVSIGRGNFDVVLRHYRNQSRVDPTTKFPAIWSQTTTFTVRYKF
jgi:hypothetical protein